MHEVSIKGKFIDVLAGLALPFPVSPRNSIENLSSQKIKYYLAIQAWDTSIKEMILSLTAINGNQWTEHSAERPMHNEQFWRALYRGIDRQPSIEAIRDLKSCLNELRAIADATCLEVLLAADERDDFGNFHSTPEFQQCLNVMRRVSSPEANSAGAAISAIDGAAKPPQVFKTSGGHIGFARGRNVRLGDTLFLPDGCPVQFVARLDARSSCRFCAETHTNNTTSTAYQLIAYAWVDGMMEGTVDTWDMESQDIIFR